MDSVISWLILAIIAFYVIYLIIKFLAKTSVNKEIDILKTYTTADLIYKNSKNKY